MRLTGNEIRDINTCLKKGLPLPIKYKELLFAEEKKPKEYELVYADKEREEDILADTMAVPLQPVKTFGQNGNGWTNKLIFGNNLQVLKSLLDDPEIAGQVKLIYIDPPFATKQEFKGSQDQKAYQDRVVGSQFLEFLRKRLIFLRELLSNDGCIYLHLDEHMAHYGKIIMDEIFGKQRFLNDIIWYYPDNFQGNVNRFANNHNIIFLYSKTSDYFFKRVQIPLDKKTKRDIRIWDKDKQAVVAARDENGQIIYKEFSVKTADDVWTIGQSSVSKKHSDEHLGYPTQKPEALLKRIIQASSEPKDLIIDCFAGSGTTLAVAEKLGRRWIGIDCGKLAIYTMQKRLLSIAKSKNLEDPKKKYRKTCEPFTLYNAGLYDYQSIKTLPWDQYRTFVLQLFQCRDEKHTIASLELDGYLGLHDVLVFNYQRHKDVMLDRSYVDSLHDIIGDKAGGRFFVIAPAASISFLEDYIPKDETKYFFLRIPYSIIQELHNKGFTSIKQPSSELDVNDTIESVGFDFIQIPQVHCKYFLDEPKEKTLLNGDKEAVIKIEIFRSRTLSKQPEDFENYETLSMVMLDYKYNGEVFNMDEVFYAEELKDSNYEVRVDADKAGSQLMVIYIDVFGNEKREVKALSDFKEMKVARTRKANISK